MAARNKLTDATLRALAQSERHDGGGLYFKKDLNGASWYFRYAALPGPGVKKGARRKMGLGGYPAVSLADARRQAEWCRSVRARGLDPKVERARQRREAELHHMTVRQAATACFEAKKAGLRGKNEAGEWLAQLENHAFKSLGNMKVRDLSVADIVDALDPIWRKKAPTAKKVLNRLDQSIRFASINDNAIDMTLGERARLALGAQAHKVEHHAALPWADLPALYAALGDTVDQRAFAFYITTVTRVGVVRRMEWSALEGDIWALKEGEMKAGRAFNVPLNLPACEPACKVDPCIGVIGVQK